jgi:hypothetical protein
LSNRQNRTQRNQRLTGSNFTLQKSVHWVTGAKVTLNLLSDYPLTVCEFKGQSLIK